MIYMSRHLKRLTSEAHARFDYLLDALDTEGAGEKVVVDGAKIRLAVDDFKTILTEIRRLK